MLTRMLSPTSIFIRVLAVFLVLPIHEFAHGYMAYKLGDNTAKYQGRLTINPFAHLNLVGTLSLILAGFGWANPVPVNPNNFRDRKKGMALTALAGPLSNIILALITMVIAKIIARVAITFGFGSSNVIYTMFQLFMILTTLSISLGVFNLIPVPPLDGSRIMLLFLPEKYYFKLMQYERYIALVVMLLAFSGGLSLIISPISSAIFNLLDFITSFIY